MTPTLARSLRWTGPGGEECSFPTFYDIANHLVATGEIARPEELSAERVDLLGDVFLQWVGSGQLGCLFAMRLARTPDQAGWTSVTPAVDDGLARRLQPILEAAAGTAEALQIILPGVATAERVVEVINILCRHPGWYWEEIPSTQADASGCFLVGLRWSLPSEGARSWTLGFAPIDSMPFTRRFVGAPFSALVFRTITPPPSDDLPGVVHLAYMPTLGAPESYGEKTSKLKRELVGDAFPDAAKAKVTFSLPMAVRALLVPPRPNQWREDWRDG